jgi:hypothetical protein
MYQLLHAKSFRVDRALLTEHSWQHAIYHVDEPTSHFHTPLNKGREAMAYLTYIIDTYQDLPKMVAFIHPHGTGWPAAWHNDAPGYDAVTMLTTLGEEFVLEHGYANLRCLHNPGCPAEVRPFRGPYEEGEEHKPHEQAMAASWIELFGGDNSSVPEVLATPCCSQFAVSRSQILARPKQEYEHFRDWLLKTELDDFTSGRVFEYLWHVIFGGEAVHCPNQNSCYCDQYGRC